MGRMEHHAAASRIDRDGLQKMLDDGLTQQQCAQAYGVHVRAIERRVSAWGLRTARTGPRSGHQHPEWSGGRVVDKHGYILVWAPMHPQARRPSGYIAEHRLVLEVALGRYLKAREVVDHIDDHPRHNWPENLRAFPSNADHLRATLTGREKSTPRRSIAGAYRCNQKLDHCPDERETLAQCSSAIRQKLVQHIEIHRPTIEHQAESRRSILRRGAWSAPFRSASTA